MTEGADDNIMMGINVKSDVKFGKRYADLMVDGNKKYETRDSNSLKPYIGRRMAVIRTGEGTAKAIGHWTVGEPIVVDNEKEFRAREHEHLVPNGSTFDIKKGQKKYLYPVIDPQRWEEEKDVARHGIIARKLIEK